MSYQQKQYDENSWHKCKSCEMLEDNLKNAQEFCEAIVKQLYIKGEFNKELLEFQLDELCHYLGVKIVPGFLEIEPKKQPTILNDWIAFSKDIAKQTNTIGH